MTKWIHSNVPMKDSGIPWLGKVPAHWEIEKLKHISTIRFSNVDKKVDSSEIPVLLCNYVDVYNNDKITSDMDFMQASATLQEIEKFKLQPGDILVTKDSESAEDIAIPALVVDVKPNLICGYHLALVRPRQTRVDPGYLYYLYECKAFRTQYEIRANGVTRFGLSQEAFKDSILPVPELEEQISISAFLDRETAKLDQLVEKKQRLIELLQEYRQALITQAVTKGLDPNVPMKDSGIPWLGEVPAHWDVAPLKRLLSAVDYGTSQSLDGYGPYRVLTMGDIQNGEIRIPDSGQLEGVDHHLVLRHNDLLYNRTNSLEQICKAGIFRGDESDQVTFASYLVRLRTNEKISPEYLNYLLNCPPVLSMARSMAIPSIQQANLNPTRYVEMKLPYPPTVQEQTDILVFITERSETLVSLIDKLKEQIAKISEYRQTLVSAAVTGQIDVGHYAENVAAAPASS